MKILLADDHTLFREGMRLVLSRLGPDTTVVEAADHQALLELATAHPDANLALIDLGMPGADPFQALKQLLGRFPTLPVVVLSASEDPDHMRRALDLGVMGYIPKRETAEVMLHALRLVLAGGVYIPPLLVEGMHTGSVSRGATPLTPRQGEVLGGMVAGKPNKEIGRELGMSEATVKAHVTAILRVLNVTNRTQAVSAAQRLGLGLPRRD